MPFYEHSCPDHGKFEVFKLMCQSAELERCPTCGRVAIRVFSASVIKMVEKKRLAFGSGSPGKMLTSKETGGLDIFIPSMGAMEQEEVDYIAEVAVDKEKERVKKTHGHPRSRNQARIQAYAQLGRKAKRGQRAKTIREAIAQEGDRLVKV